MLLALLLSMPAQARDLRVVATVPDLAAIAQQIAPDAKVTAMSLPTQDPHFVDARPSLALDLSKADALLLVGLDLELGWLPTLLTGSRNGKLQAGAPGYIDCSRFVQIQDIPTVVDRSAGDIHPGGNPHYLYDPRTTAAVALGIATQLATINPDNAATYAQNASEFSAKLALAVAGWEAELAPLQGRNVITYHRSFVYLTSWLDLDVVARIEPKPGVPPTPRHVAHVTQVAQQEEVKAILQEVYYPSTNSELIADRLGAEVIAIPGGADFARGQTYLQHYEGIVAMLGELL